jgi:predicted nucleic acid-binding Zn ribbon protein
MALERAASTSMARRLFGGVPGAQLALLRAAWPAVVGREIARRSEVVSLDRRTLNIRVVDSGWQRVLHRMQRQILARLAEIAADLAPTRIGFTVGPVAGSADAAAAPRLPRDRPRAPAEVTAAAEAIEDEELREGFLRSAALYLERKEHA